MNKNPDYEQLGKQVETYCKTYDIPLDFFFNILNDQKVVPMLRGKGMEYNALAMVRHHLNPNEWAVHKLNANPQPGSPDQDISITHLRTGITLTVETKSAVRGSLSLGTKSRLLKDIPHFKVKCHRSRSNISLSDSTNDRYKFNAFDVLITNPSNALFQQGTVGEHLELLDNPKLLAFLYQNYQVSDNQNLIEATNKDWRFVLPEEIAENGFIPRTPYVYVMGDKHWLSLEQLQTKLTEVVNQKFQARKKVPRN